MSKGKSIKIKQLTLAAFGFKKAIVPRVVETEVKLPTGTTEVSCPCDNCELKSKSFQGLSFHVRNMHQNVICNSVPLTSKK